MSSGGRDMSALGGEPAHGRRQLDDAPPRGRQRPPHALPTPHQMEREWIFQVGDMGVCIKLDGFSHASTRRRAYARCPYHASCFKYATLLSFPEPWMAIGSILVYLRAGAKAEDKREHQQVPTASITDMMEVVDEMPPEMFSSDLILSLEGQ